MVPLTVLSYSWRPFLSLAVLIYFFLKNICTHKTSSESVKESIIVQFFCDSGESLSSTSYHASILGNRTYPASSCAVKYTHTYHMQTTLHWNLKPENSSFFWSQTNHFLPSNHLSMYSICSIPSELHIFLPVLSTGQQLCRLQALHILRKLCAS